MRHSLLLFACLATAACGGDDEPLPAAGQNETQRIQDQIEKKAAQISRQAENGTAAIEQALENEQAGTFENRDNLLNESAENEAVPAPAGR